LELAIEREGGEMKKCYYAHPITDYGTSVEQMDIAVLESLGYEVVNPNKAEYDEAYQTVGMMVFLDLVMQCDVVAFRGFRDGTIPAGVGKEVFHALKCNIPFFELPAPVGPRTLSVEDTRAKLKALGRK
jgi:hypothetical protein